MCTCMVASGPTDRTVPVICASPDPIVITTVSARAIDQMAPFRRRRRPEFTMRDFQGTSSRKDRPRTPWATVAARDQPVPRPWATRPEARARIRSPASARLVNRFTPLLPPGFGSSTDCGYRESYACSILIVLSIRRRRVAGRFGECRKTGECLARRPLTWAFVIDRRAAERFLSPLLASSINPTYSRRWPGGSLRKAAHAAGSESSAAARSSRVSPSSVLTSPAYARHVAR